LYRILGGRDKAEVSERLANFLREISERTIEEKGVAKLGLAGGSSPRRTYEIFGRIFRRWERLLIFPTDERYVPSDDPKSNYRMLRETLGDRAKIYRVKTELTLKEACEDFDRALSKAGDLDFILLGVGEDGHTASLFPKTPCLPCGENACTSRSSDGLDRVSMSFEFINRSKRKAFIVLGKRKRRVFEGMLNGKDMPAARVKGKEVLIFTDLYSPSSRSSFSISK